MNICFFRCHSVGTTDPKQFLKRAMKTDDSVLSYSGLSYILVQDGNSVFRCRVGDVFFNVTCHSVQKDERQGPFRCQYNQQDKRSADKHSVQQLCQLRQKIKSLSTV